MSSPLVSRPGYGEKRPIAESGLPKGTPGGRGIPLDDSIPGTSTYVKPLDDDGKVTPKDDSIYKVDSPRELGKKKDQGDVKDLSDGVDHSHAAPSYYGLGKPDDSNSKSKYPYRDDVSNSHNASVEFIAGMWGLRVASDRVVQPGARLVIAATPESLLTGLNPKFMQRSKTCAVSLKRADIGNLRWIFSVDCGNGVKAVRVKASRGGNQTQFSRLDLHVACSCPAWRWQGPEFHSTTKEYQDPNTALQGTASVPDIRDPERHNNVCKHVAATLLFTRSWTLPPKK